MRTSIKHVLRMRGYSSFQNETKQLNYKKCNIQSEPKISNKSNCSTQTFETLSILKKIEYSPQFVTTKIIFN